MVGLDPNSTALNASFLRQQGYAAPTSQDNEPSDSNDNSDNGITLNVSPSADNVSTGDRSQNSVLVTLTTPNQQVQTEITRGQAFDALAQRNENNTNEQIVENTVGGVGNNPNPIQQAIVGNVIDSGQLDRETGVDLLESRLTYNAAQTAFSSFNTVSTTSPNSNTATQDPLGINGVTNAQSAQELASQALIASTRQTLLFSETSQQSINGSQRRDAITTYQQIDSFS